MSKAELIQLAKDIDRFKNGPPDDQLFYLSCIKSTGSMMKRLYMLHPTPELKKSILQLAKIIQQFPDIKL